VAAPTPAPPIEVEAAPPAVVAPALQPAPPAAAGAAASAGGTVPGAVSDVVAQLEQLAALRGAGTLTDAEFQTAKQRVLGGR
jgi:hypothetical protein